MCALLGTLALLASAAAGAMLVLLVVAWLYFFLDSP